MGSFDQSPTAALEAKLRDVAYQLTTYISLKFMDTPFEDIQEVEEFDMQQLKSMYILRTMKLKTNGDILKYCNNREDINKNFTKAVICQDGLIYSLDNIPDDKITNEMSATINVSVYNHFSDIMMAKYGDSAKMFIFSGDEDDEYKLVYGLYAIHIKDRHKLFTDSREFKRKLSPIIAENSNLILPNSKLTVH